MLGVITVWWGKSGPAAGRAATQTSGVPSSDGQEPVVNLHSQEPAPSNAPLDSKTQTQLGAQLAAARLAARAYPTAAAAMRAGYKFAEGYEHHVGSHYYNFEAIDGTVDPGHPEMLLFDGNGPDARLVGLTYYVYWLPTQEPDGFAGPNDHWHKHPGVCFTRGGPLFDPGVCIHRSDNAWMLHVWVIPDYESPDGVFSATNRTVP
jgi:hypothetical protein